MVCGSGWVRFSAVCLLLGSGAGCGKESPPAKDSSTSATSGIDLDTEGTDSADSAGTDSATTHVIATEANPESFTSGCGEVDVQVEPVTPTIVLLVDQSGSMTSDFQGVDRWDAIYETLMDPDDGVVAMLEGLVRFGLTLYTSEDGYDGGECPMLTSVGPALNNRDAIDGVFAPANPVDETPTGESLEAVAIELAAFDEEGPKAIVLATDGEPDTCEQPNPQEGQPESLAAAELAYSMGITTFVISVGNEVGADHLQEMANVGVGKPPDDPNPAPYYQALNADELVAAFDEIIGTFVSCQLTINGEVDLAKACEGTVVLDGEVLECGVDWEVTDPTTLDLLGEACETLKDGDPHDVAASWPCGVVSIP